MIDHLKSVAVFVRAVELGSFRAAGRALGLSPSVVGHHVGRLEARLDRPLIHRTTRQLSLAADGERFYAGAREALRHAALAFDAVSGGDGPLSGHLRVACPALLTETEFCGVLAAFGRSHPQVRLELSFSEVRRDLLRDGYDLAVRIGHMEGGGLKARKLAELPRRLVAAPSYLAMRRPPGRPEDLPAVDFVHLSVRPPQLVLRPQAGGEPVTVALTPRVLADSAAAIRGLVLSGAGVASLPDLLVREALRDGRLVEVLPEFRLAPVAMFAVWPDAAQRPVLAMRFLGFVEGELRTINGVTPADPRAGA